MARRIRPLRHWKQRFNPNARFIFRKQTRWDGSTTFQPGDEVPPGLLPPHKLRRFWEAGRVELAEFDEPRDVSTGFNHAEDNPERAQALGETSVTSLGGNWYLIKAADGREFKERGKAKMNARLDELAAEFEALERERREAEAAEAERLKQAEEAAQAKADELKDGASSAPDDDADTDTDSAEGETDGGDGETETEDGETASDDSGESEPGSETDTGDDETAATETEDGADPGGAEGTEDGTEPEPSGEGSTSDAGDASAIDYNTAAQMPMEALRELGVPHGITDRDKTKLLEKLVDANLVMPPPEDSSA